MPSTKAKLEPFIDNYIKRGFGSMNKNDFEVEIFHYLMENGYFSSNNDYDISTELMIPQSKVKRLKYEAKLKHPQTNNVENDLENILKNAQIITNKDVIVISIEDELTRKFVDSEIKKSYGFIDTSFNAELVKIKYDDYALLVKKFLGKDIDAELKKKYDSKDEDYKNTHEFIASEILFEIAKGAANELGKLIIGAAYILPILLS